VGCQSDCLLRPWPPQSRRALCPASLACPGPGAGRRRAGTWLRGWPRSSGDRLEATSWATVGAPRARARLPLQYAPAAGPPGIAFAPKGGVAVTSRLIGTGDLELALWSPGDKRPAARPTCEPVLPRAGLWPRWPTLASAGRELVAGNRRTRGPLVWSDPTERILKSSMRYRGCPLRAAGWPWATIAARSHLFAPDQRPLTPQKARDVSQFRHPQPGTAGRRSRLLVATASGTCSRCRCQTWQRRPAPSRLTAMPSRTSVTSRPSCASVPRAIAPSPSGRSRAGR